MLAAGRGRRERRTPAEEGGGGGGVGEGGGEDDGKRAGRKKRGRVRGWTRKGKKGGVEEREKFSTEAAQAQAAGGAGEGGGGNVAEEIGRKKREGARVWAIKGKQ